MILVDIDPFKTELKTFFVLSDTNFYQEAPNLIVSYSLKYESVDHY